MKFSQLRAINKEAAKKTEALHECLKDTAKKIAEDQSAWLDGVMRDILPPKLYEAGTYGDLMDEIHEYLKKHKFSVVYIPDSMGIRVMRGSEVHAEFIPQIALDGEPIPMVPVRVDGAGLN